MEASQAPRVAVAEGGLAPLDVMVHALSQVMGAGWEPEDRGLALALPLVGMMPCVKLLDVEEVGM